jgi:tetratricopeptide (TPR) repeat protein
VLARDAFGEEREVAVKTLDQKALPARAFPRVQREYMLRRAIRHPGCAALLDLDFDDAGNCRLISEYVGGPDFVSAAGACGPDALAELAVELLQALGHLHDCGLLHGAIKPTNVRMTKGASQAVKLLDFDVRPDHEISPAAPAATLHHASPEILRGQPADLSADLYGVGMLLYEAIAGRLPFDDSEHGPGIVAWHLGKGVVRSPGQHVLAPVVTRLLDPDPERRFASTHEAIRAIGVACGRRFRPRTQAGGEQVLVSGRYVGREREMARLEGACRRLLAGGGAQMFLIVGPPGIGKSRALEESRVLAQMSGVRVAQARCRRERSAPLGVLRDLLHQILVLVGTDHPAAQSHLSVLREVVPETVGHPPAGRPIVAAEHDWIRIKNGVAEFIAAAAQVRPLMLLIDDMRRIDESSFGVLRWVLRHFSGSALMVLGAIEESEDGAPSNGVACPIENDAHEVLRLDPLGVAEVERILAGVLALPGSVRELTGLILRLTGGVPLFVEETLRSLVEGRMVDLLAEGTVGLDALGPVEARERAIQLIAGRLERLPERAQQVLEALVLFDGAAPSCDLALAADLRTGEIDGAIARLETADLVHVEPSLAGVQVGLRGVLFREAALRRLSPERLAARHDAVIDRLEQPKGGTTVERTAELAFHALRGTRPAVAVRLSLAAAKDAMALHAYDRARDLLRHARRSALAAGDAAATLVALDLLAETHERIGDFEAALLVLDELAAAPTAPRAAIVGARLRATAIRIKHGRPAAAERTLDAAAPEAAELGDPLLSSRVERLRASLLVRKGNAARALVVLERARALLLATGAAGELAHVIAEIGEAHAQLDEHELARTRHRESLARFVALRDPAGVALAHRNLAQVSWREGRFEEGISRLRRSERVARKLGHYTLLSSALLQRGEMEAASGRLSEAVRTLTAAVHLARRLDDEPGTCAGLAQLGWAHHLAGRHEMARMLIEEVVTRRGRLNDLSGVAAARVLLGRILCVVGALDDSETLLRTAADAAEQLGLDTIAVAALHGLAEVAVRRELPDEALSLVERLQRLAAGRLDRFTRTSCELLRAGTRIRGEGAREIRDAVAAALRRAREGRMAEALVEGRRLAGLSRGGAAALVSLRAALRTADRAGLRELSWRVRADLGDRLFAAGAFGEALETMKEAMVLLRRLHDDLPPRRRDAYLADSRKQALREAFATVIDRVGVPAA